MYDQLVDEFRRIQQSAIQVSLNYDMVSANAARFEQEYPDTGGKVGREVYQRHRTIQKKLEEVDEQWQQKFKLLRKAYDKMVIVAGQENIPPNYIGLKTSEYRGMNPRAVQDRLKQRLDEIATLPKEMLYSLDTYGNVIARGRYEEVNETGFRSRVDVVKSIGGAYLVHNHPGGNSPHSGADLRTCSRLRAKHCIAVTPRGVHDVVPKNGKWQKFNESEQNAYDYITSKSFSNSLDRTKTPSIPKAEKSLSKTLTRVGEIKNFTYEYTPHIKKHKGL